jgi:hypothetical protein
LWRGNIPQALKRVVTALVSWVTERIAMVVLKYTLAACFIKISFYEYNGSKAKAPVLDLAMNTLTDVLYIGLLYPFEYLHTRLASGAFCSASKCSAPRLLSSFNVTPSFTCYCTTPDCS